VVDKTPLRFRWSHLHPMHRRTVKVANRLLSRLPLRPKYAATARLRRSKLPYSLVGPGSVVIQVGAPADTLHAGRSRGMHLAIKSHGGAALIVEPDPHSAAEFGRCARELGLDHVTVVNAGAWDHEDTLSLLVDPSHPATNFVDGQVPYDDSRRADFTAVEVPVRTLDDMAAEAFGPGRKVDLVSITTNNSEREILAGMDQLVANGLEFLCLARTGEGYHGLARELGFEFLGNDDRGFTYRRRPTSG
jgi:FkbM family methyltransferase